MAKTLRITTFFIAVVALGFIIFIAAKGIASDKGFEKFLSAQGVAEQLQAGSVGKKAPDVEQDTPLIRQAKAFALRINPPPPPEPVRTEPAPQEAPRPKVEVSAKFTLVGTSYHTGDENNSWALINEVGKGWHWVRQGEKIGYLIIEKIGDGVVLIRDGSNTYELTAERQQKPDYVKSFTGTLEKTVIPWQGKQKAVSEAVSKDQNSVSSTENAQPAAAAENKATKEEVQANINWLKQIQANPESAGMTAEEANELGNLGDMLKTLEKEAKEAESNEPNAPAEPNNIPIKDANDQKSSPPEITEKPQSEPDKTAPEPPRRQFRRNRR